MAVWVYQGGQRYSLLDPIGYIGTARAPVNEIHAYHDGTRTLVWSRNPAEVTATSTQWDQAVITWIAPGAGADSYRLKRGGTQVYAGTALTFTDVGLLGATAYTYSLEVIRAGAVVSTITRSVTTPARPAPVLTATSSIFDKVALSWTDSVQGGVDTYVIKRGSTQVYSGATKSFTDTGLQPGTTYNYTLESYRAGVLVPPSVAKSATTLVLPAFSMTAGATSYGNISTSWTSLGAGWTYTLVGNGAALVSGTTATSYNHGVGEQTTVNYRTDAIFSGAVWRQATASATTPARPTSSGSVFGPAATTSGGWVQSSGKTLIGPILTMPATGYITAANLLVWAHYSGGTGDFDPHIDGNYFGRRNVTGGRNFQGYSTGNYAAGAGAHSFGCKVGGTANATEWDAYTGAPSWDPYVAVGQFNYWYYTALERDHELRAHPWWRDEMAERSIHIETWCDHEGQTIRARVVDKQSGELIVVWERD